MRCVLAILGLHCWRATGFRAAPPPRARVRRASSADTLDSAAADAVPPTPSPGLPAGAAGVDMFGTPVAADGTPMMGPDDDDSVAARSPLSAACTALLSHRQSSRRQPRHAATRIITHNHQNCALTTTFTGFPFKTPDRSNPYPSAATAHAHHKSHAHTCIEPPPPRAQARANFPMGMNSFTTCFASALGVALVAMLAASGPTEWLGLGSTAGVCEIDATEGVPDNFAERYYAASKPVLLRKHRANRVSCMEESMCALRSFQINFAEFQEHGLAVEGSVTVVQPKSLPPAIRTPAPFFDGPGVWAAIHADARRANEQRSR